MNKAEARIAAETLEDVFFNGHAVTIAELDIDGDGISSAFVTGQRYREWVRISDLELGHDSIAREEAKVQYVDYVSAYPSFDCSDSRWREWITSKLLKIAFAISPHWNCNGVCGHKK